MPIVWQLKIDRNEQKNTFHRLEIRHDFEKWLNQQIVPRNTCVFGQDIIKNQIWIVFKEEKYESLFAVSFMGKSGYRLVKLDQPRTDPWPTFTTSRVDMKSL